MVGANAFTSVTPVNVRIVDTYGTVDTSITVGTFSKVTGLQNKTKSYHTGHNTIDRVTYGCKYTNNKIDFSGVQG